jgi:cytochrome c biogenesis protein CcmG, thiol:disulfide interchange protein DsbE
MLARLASHRYALRSALSVLILALLAAGLLAHASTARLRAPALPTRALSGTSTTLADLRGHAAVVVFWASWCAACHTEAAAIERFARSPAGRGRVVAIDYSDGGDWRAFLRAYHWSIPVLADPTGRVGDAFQIHFLPSTVFLDPSGRIAATSEARQTVASLASGLSAAA